MRKFMALDKRETERKRRRWRKTKKRKLKRDDTAEVLKADRQFQGFALLTYKSQRKK